MALVTTTIMNSAGRPTSLRVRNLRLLVASGPDKNRQTELMGRELRVGTHASNHLVLTDQAVSRFHFRIIAQPDGFRLIDAASTNGTHINGVRVRDGFVPDAAVIRVGDTSISATSDNEEGEVPLSSNDFFGIALGRSLPMREVFALSERIAPTDTTVLLTGETGTGKDVLARALHGRSTRAGGPFVALDCGAIPANLIESALFGHTRGAFTGADSDRAGVFQVAHGGTLFIDEIGELTPSLQPRLLRVLESRRVTPVGSTSEIPVDVRIIAATNRDLRTMVEEDRFRSDLYYRLAVVPIELPPLRDRPDDIPLLVGHFLTELLSRDGRKATWLSSHLEDAFAGLSRYSWPGNIRELRNVVERAVALSDPSELSKDGIAQLVELRSSVGRSIGAPLPLETARRQFDQQYLRELLETAHGDIRRASEIAQIHAKSLERLLRKYKVPRP